MARDDPSGRPEPRRSSRLGMPVGMSGGGLDGEVRDGVDDVDGPEVVEGVVPAGARRVKDGIAMILNVEGEVY